MKGGCCCGSAKTSACALVSAGSELAAASSGPSVLRAGGVVPLLIIAREADKSGVEGCEVDPAARPSTRRRAPNVAQNLCTIATSFRRDWALSAPTRLPKLMLPAVCAGLAAAAVAPSWRSPSCGKKYSVAFELSICRARCIKCSELTRRDRSCHEASLELSEESELE